MNHQRNEATVYEHVVIYNGMLKARFEAKSHHGIKAVHFRQDCHVRMRERRREMALDEAEDVPLDESAEWRKVRSPSQLLINPLFLAKIPCNGYLWRDTTSVEE